MLGLSFFPDFHYEQIIDIILFELWHIDGLVQDRRDSSALAMEIRRPCINSSIYAYHYHGSIND